MLGFGLGPASSWASPTCRRTFPEPFEVADAFGFLPGQDCWCARPRAGASPTSALSFDAASVGRLGRAGTRPLQAAPTWIVIDHHASNPGFGAIRLVDPARRRDRGRGRAAARPARRQSGPRHRDLPLRGAGHRHRLVQVRRSPRPRCTRSRLGWSRPAPSRPRWPGGSSTAGRSRRSSCSPRCSARAELDPAAAGGAGLISAYATLADLERFGQPSQVLESFMDVLRTAEEADVACLVKPVAPGRWAVSLRSRGETDVRGGGRAGRWRTPARGRIHRLRQRSDVLTSVRGKLDSPT